MSHPTIIFNTSWRSINCLSSLKLHIQATAINFMYTINYVPKMH
ncbi:unnamed protein product, partial [Vitis vinifera]|uniref:Uncharacterized protein n=1 Tax=Vitis vinifera TaxID=29760 RepID=D7SLK2_VITVI